MSREAAGQNEPSPNLDDVNFQILVVRGMAASGRVSIPTPGTR
jgi:hypothetical protein